MKYAEELLACRGERPAPSGATGPEDDAKALASYPEAVEPAALATCQAGAWLTLSEADSIRGHALVRVAADSLRHYALSTLVCWALWTAGVRLQDLCLPTVTLHCLHYTAAEVASVRDAMAAVRGALDALASNVDASQDAVLCLNARDARTGLARRLDQLSPATLRSAVRAHPALCGEGYGLFKCTCAQMLGDRDASSQWFA